MRSGWLQPGYGSAGTTSTAAFESESTFVSSSTPGKITALNLYTPLYGVPEKPNESNRQSSKYRFLETKVLQMQIITEKENVVESIINNYYWGKLIEKLIKSNTKN